ncbi:MAG: hypothetical protein K5880_03040 [Hydrogenophaga sp.]|nr:hypothetical protein [Hydrogenophaga sp.]
MEKIRRAMGRLGTFANDRSRYDGKLEINGQKNLQVFTPSAWHFCGSFTMPSLRNRSITDSSPIKVSAWRVPTNEDGVVSTYSLTRLDQSDLPKWHHFQFNCNEGQLSGVHATRAFDLATLFRQYPQATRTGGMLNARSDATRAMCSNGSVPEAGLPFRFLPLGFPG